MLSVLSCLCACVFVPFSGTASPARVRVRDIVTQRAAHCAVLGLRRGAPDLPILEHRWRDTAELFDGAGAFAVFDDSAAEEVARARSVSLPAIFVYESGFLMGCYPYPSDDTAVLLLLELALRGTGAPAESVAAACRALGPGAFTLLAPAARAAEARFLQFRVGAQMGPVHVVPVSSAVLNSFGISGDSLALFRREDMHAVPVAFDTGSVYAASYPVFRNLGASDLTERERVVFALVAGALTDEYGDFLFEVGMRHPEAVVGFLSASSEYVASVATTAQRVFPQGRPAVAVFNIDRNIHYSTDEWFGELEKLPFEPAKWVRAANGMLGMIKEGRLQPAFASEEEPPEEPGAHLVKVVGTTYEKFISDPEHDVVVLFKRDNCEHCQKFFGVLKDFAEECAREKVDTVKFGYIDIHKNSAKCGFPYISGVPHVHIFPAKNKTENDKLRGENTRDGLIRFIKRYGSNDIPFEPGPIDKGEVAMEVLQLLLTVKEMPNEEQMKTLKYIEEMSKYMNTTKTKTIPQPDYNEL